jgi:carboxylesterase
MDGCLIIHGLTGTPATVASLKESLMRAGYRVAVPCLAGHGMRVEDLADSTWREWYETVRISFDSLRREVGRVYCAGISLGALLSLKLALDEGWGVRALALLATPLRLSFLEAMAVPLVRYTPLRWLIKSVPKDMEKSVADPDGRVVYAQQSLPAIPTRAVFEISDLQRDIESGLGKIANPILMLHGAGDKVAPKKNIDLVRHGVKSDIVEVAIFPRSRHVITLDYDKDEVARTTVEFFKRFS